jgi:hypothetical protein
MPFALPSARQKRLGARWLDFTITTTTTAPWDFELADGCFPADIVVRHGIGEGRFRLAKRQNG